GRHSSRTPDSERLNQGFASKALFWCYSPPSQSQSVSGLAMRERRGNLRCFTFIFGAGALAAACLLAGSRNAGAQQASSGAAIGVRAATPQEIQRSIQAEERQIEATPAIAGLPKRLAFYIRRELPSLSVLDRSDATDE